MHSGLEPVKRLPIGAPVESPFSAHASLDSAPYLSPRKISTREVGATGMPALHHDTENTDVIGKVKEALIQRIGSDRYGLWFEQTAWFRLESDSILVEVEGEFALHRLRTNYFRHIESAAAQALGRLVTIRMELQADGDSAMVEAPKLATPPSMTETTQPLSPSCPTEDSQQSQNAQPIKGLREMGASKLVAGRVIRASARTEPVRVGSIRGKAIDSRSPRAETDQSVIPASGLGEPAINTTPSQGDAMTFANFAPGTSNQLARTAAQMLGERPSESAPICFWGATGTGKTHLLHAIRHELRHRHRMQRVILLSAEDFTNEFLVAVRGAGLPAFRKRYRDVDALLIDNIQFFGGKSATLREVLYTVDTIVSRRRPLVLAGDRPPMEIDGLSTELAGRMSSGLVCGLNPLEVEVRRELLRRESMRSFMPWSDEIIDALATRISGDGRLIQGVGRLVSMLQRMYRRMPTLQEIVREAGDLLQRGPRVVALADIEKAVCTAFNLPVGELRGEVKSRNVSQPRILAMYLARQHTSAAYSEIGRYFGDRNHSTVIAAYRRAEGWLKTNQSLGGRGPHGLNVQEAIDTVENLLRIG